MSVLDLFKLEGKLAVVTGAAQGIGFEMAKALMEAGAKVVIADLNPEVGEAAAQELGASFEAVNVSLSSSVSELAARVEAQYGAVEVLVNNAGIVRNTPAEDTSDDEWRSILSVNLDGVFWCCREFGKKMLERAASGGRGGSIVNQASMSGIISNHPQPQAAYNTSKAGVIHLTRSLAGEWASRGVRVNAIAPGYTATPLTKRGLETPGWKDTWLGTTPMGRTAEPFEIAPAAVYLASDASSFVTGSVLVVDGGYTVW